MPEVPLDGASRAIAWFWHGFMQRLHADYAGACAVLRNIKVAHRVYLKIHR